MNISKYKSFIKVVQYTLILIGFAIFISSKNNETTTWEQILQGLLDKVTMVFLFMLYSYLNHQMRVKEILILLDLKSSKDVENTSKQ